MAGDKDSAAQNNPRELIVRAMALTSTNFTRAAS
jgi:hypothetical protein